MFISILWCKIYTFTEQYFYYVPHKYGFRTVGRRTFGRRTVARGQLVEGQLVARTFGRNALSMRNMKFEKNRILLFFL